jgi:type II secretion system protein C
VEIAREVPPPPAPSAATPAIPQADATGIPHTKLPLELLGTVVSEDPARSLATIRDIERVAHEVMKEGQEFAGRPDVSVARIERTRILIDNEGVREQLALAHRAPAEAANLSPEEREYRRDLARRLRELTDAGTNYRDVLGEGERGGLLAEGEVSPVYEDGEMVGVQFDAIREGGLYDRIGLRNGDVVTEINGVWLGDPAAPSRVAGEFVTAPELSLAVERGDGSAATIVVPTGPFEKALQGLDPQAAD